jgi:DNA topoisomerase-1
VRLRRSDCRGPGFTRRRAGRGFAYYDHSGRKVADTAEIERIRALVIPPAWTDVWICPQPNGHIQALGTDARGRRQYRYHDGWRVRRDQEKFDRMCEFARALPRLRKACGAHLDEEGMTKERVLAAAGRLLDLGFFRIGTEEYAEDNETYGLATMLKEHVSVDGDLITFDYPAKGGKQRLQSVADPAVVAVIAALKRRRGGGQELLAYRQGNRWCDVKSADINAFVKEHMGSDFTAKDFRTWNATVLCAVALAVSVQATSPTARKRAVRRAIEEAAHYLGNTPAVCRSSYVDPRVVDRYLAEDTISAALHKLGDGASFGQLATQGAVERAVLSLLADAPPVSAAAA